MMSRLRLRVEENRRAVSGIFGLMKENSIVVVHMEASLTEHTDEIREIKADKLKDKKRYDQVNGRESGGS